MPPVTAVDVHAHVAVPAADALLEGHPGLDAQHALDAATLGPASLRRHLEQVAEIGPNLLDRDLRPAAMGAARVDVQCAHGGGLLASYMVRADHAWGAQEDARTTEHRPSELLRRTYVDSLASTPEQLHHLVAAMGPGPVTVGSDYPFDMGVEDPLEAAGFEADTVAAIRGGNVGRLPGPIPSTSLEEA